MDSFVMYNMYACMNLYIDISIHDMLPMNIVRSKWHNKMLFGTCKILNLSGKLSKIYQIVFA